MNTDRRTIFTQFHDRLNQFRVSKELCDVTIQIEDKTFCCHRIVLASACKYFATMFTGPFEESKSDNVKLNDTKPEIFEEMLSFMYTGDIKINAENVCDLLIASEYLGLYFIEELCTTYFVENRSIQNVFEIFRFALTTGKNRLVGVLVTYISDNFLHLCQLDAFFVISYEMLKLILQAIRYMKFENVDVIVSSVIEWVRYNPDERKLLIPELLQMLDTANISINYINMLIACVMDTNSKIKNENFDICSDRLNNVGEIDLPQEKVLRNISPLNADVYCKKNNGSYWLSTVALNKNKCQWEFVRSFDLATWNIRPRSRHNQYLPSFKRVGVGNKLYSFFISSNGDLIVNYSLAENIMLELIRVRSPPNLPRVNEFNVCAVANTIYLYNLEVPPTGHGNADLNSEELSRGILSYKCNSDRWSKVPPLVWKVKDASLVSCANNIMYLLGGWHMHDTAECGRFVQRYDPRTPVWQNLSPMIHQHNNASACEHDGKIHITGGHSQLAEVFDPVAGKWEEIAPMKTTRMKHKLVSYNNLVWAIGNKTDLSCEVYDPKIDMWTRVSAMDKTVNAIKKMNESSFLDAYLFEFVG